MKKKLTINTSPYEAFAIASYCERNGRSPLEVLLSACGYQNPKPEPFLFDIQSLIEKRRHPSGKDIDERNLVKKEKIIQRRIWEDIDDSKPIGRPSGGQNGVYLALLSQLLKWDSEKVSAKLENRRGTTRLLFSKIRNDVEQAKEIPDSHPAWYARTKLPVGQKKQILCDLLRDLGFSFAYGCLISELVDNRRPQIAWLHFVSDEIPEITRLAAT